MVLKTLGKRFTIEVVVESTRGDVIHCKLLHHQAKAKKKLGGVR